MFNTHMLIWFQCFFLN